MVLPVSQAKCLNPLKLWKVNGKAKNAFNPTLAMIGRDAKLAARVADSKCQPKRGETRYAAPKTYSEPERIQPVIRLSADRYHVT